MEEGVVVGEGTTKAAWGTWEELLLGGAVLRHGADDWDAISSELRARTACPFSFTAEVLFLPSLTHFKEKQIVFNFYFFNYLFIYLLVWLRFRKTKIS